MTTYNDVVLLDKDSNRISCVPFDYYVMDGYIVWSGYIFNDTDNDINNCKIFVAAGYENVFAVSGGDLTNYTTVTSNMDTTCNFGTIAHNTMEPINLQICISGGSSLSGLQTIPLYITK